MNKKSVLIPIFIVAILIGFLTSAEPALAISFEDILTGAKQFILGDEKKELTMDSKIELAPNGDVENNGRIDAGDIVRFTFTLANKTDKKYTFAALKTNINQKQIHYIHNLYGVTGISDNGDTVVFPNFRIEANQVATISFDARINYYTEEDPTITTEAEFISNDNKSLAKASKKELKVLRKQKDKIPGTIKIENHEKIAE
jgi:hypothetical protein